MTGSETGELTLYTSRYCGYCYRVLFVIKQLALTDEHLEVIDVSKHPERRQDIVRGTGRRTVPVLRIKKGAPAQTSFADGAARRPEQWLFESHDISRYLRTRFAS